MYRCQGRAIGMTKPTDCQQFAGTAGEARVARQRVHLTAHDAVLRFPRLCPSTEGKVGSKRAEELSLRGSTKSSAAYQTKGQEGPIRSLHWLSPNEIPVVYNPQNSAICNRSRIKHHLDNTIPSHTATSKGLLCRLHSFLKRGPHRKSLAVAGPQWPCI